MLGLESPIISQFANQFPLHELYRLFYRFFAGGQRFYEGWFHGEQKEPGFIISCIYALLYELDHIDEPLSDTVLERIHQHVIQNVLNTNYSEEDFQQSKTSFREEDEFVGFGLIPGQNLSFDGLQELFSEEKTNRYGYKVATNKGKVKHYRLHCVSTRSREDARDILRSYHQAIQEVLTDKEKIQVIVQMVSKLERLHPYKDGNCRSMGLIILNRELIRNGLCPTILDDPNQFDGFSTRELVGKVLEGQQRYHELLTLGTLKTPFRSARIFDSTSKQALSREALCKRDLTHLASLEIDDAAEFDDKFMPYTGAPHSIKDSLILRFIVQTALEKAQKLKCGAALLGRLKASNTDLADNAFYTPDLSHYLLNYVLEEETITPLMFALKFGAKSALSQAMDCSKNIESFFSKYTCATDLGDISLIAYCVFVGRTQTAMKLTEFINPPEDLLTILSNDFLCAYHHQSIGKIIALVDFVSNTNLRDDSRVTLLKEAVGEYQHALKQPQGVFVSFGFAKSSAVKCKDRLLQQVIQCFSPSVINLKNNKGRCAY